MHVRRTLLLALSGVLAASAVQAQSAQRTERIGYVVAVVGDSIITNIDLQEGLTSYLEQSGATLPADSARLRELQLDVLEGLIDQSLILQAAARDTTLRVSAADVERSVDGQVRQITQNLGGEVALTQALEGRNMTMQSYRTLLTERFRTQMLSQRYVMSVSRERKPPPVSEEEIREFFEANRASVGRLPRSINFRQVVLPVQASDSVRLALRARADSLVALAREGQDFAELARRNSQDPSSAAQGGELGFFRIGDMVPAFEQAVFSPIARTGEIIGPVETEFGLHIIRLERIRGSERSARHILLRPAITEEDSERAQQRAEEVAAAVRAGADVDSLARLHAVTDVPVRVGPMPVDSLAPEYTTELATAQEGDVVGPFAAGRDGPTPRWVVLRVTSVQPEREATLDDLRSYIQQRIAETKQTEEIIRDLRRQSYVEVRLGQDPGGGGAL